MVGTMKFVPIENSEYLLVYLNKKIIALIGKYEPLSVLRVQFESA